MIDFNTRDYENLKIGQLKRMADYWQRQYLLRKADRGPYRKILCPIKNKYYREESMHASHFIDRIVQCTRYHVDNVHLISEESNVWDAKVVEEGYKSKHHKEFEYFLINKIGQKKFEDLLEMSKEICIFDKEDYIEIIEKFRESE